MGNGSVIPFIYTPIAINTCLVEDYSAKLDFLLEPHHHSSHLSHFVL